MSDYQAIYDAVRSKISNGDIGSAVESALMNCGFDHAAMMAGYAIQNAAAQYERPSAIYRPALYPDGNKWCALYGEDLQAGLAGFGDTPALAMEDFDKNWSGQKLGRTGQKS